MQIFSTLFLVIQYSVILLMTAILVYNRKSIRKELRNGR